jgi:hypothetical protein
MVRSGVVRVVRAAARGDLHLSLNDESREGGLAAFRGAAGPGGPRQSTYSMLTGIPSVRQARARTLKHQ